MDMYNHVLLEVFCLKPDTENIVNCKGIYIDRNLWRKNELVKIDSPINVMSNFCYYMDFCSEYLDSNGEVHKKSESFCRLAKELLQYCKDEL